MFLNYGVSTGLSLDYNIYWASGSGGMLGSYNSTNSNSTPIVSGLEQMEKVNPNFPMQEVRWQPTIKYVNQLKALQVQE
jgi:hypothetical protein